MKSTDWHNKVCLVTGASSGLGVAIASAFASRGAKVIVAARRETLLKQTAENLSAAGGHVEPVVADVTNQQDVDQLHATIAERYGQLDVLCNCAGRSARGNLLETSTEDFQQLLDVNFLSAVRTTRSFAPMLIQQQGHVINIGSLASKVAPRFMGGYSASKFALAAYSQQLRLETAPQGLHVLLVCPGPILREDNAPRYTEQSANIPAAAAQPGAGANLRGIDPNWLAERILTACQHRQPELVIPWKVRLLTSLAQLSPRLGDWLLLRSTSG